MHAKTASNVMTAALFVYMLMQPAFGALSDRIGRRTSMLPFGAGPSPPPRPPAEPCQDAV